MNPKLFFGSFMLAAAIRVLTDGPSDNLPDKVRRIPPPGMAISASDRSDLEAGVADLGRQIESLRTSLTNRPALLDLLPGVQIYQKAVDGARRLGLEKVDVEFIGEQEVAMKVFAFVGFSTLLRLPGLC